MQGIEITCVAEAPTYLALLSPRSDPAILLGPSNRYIHSCLFIQHLGKKSCDTCGVLCWR